MSLQIYIAKFKNIHSFRLTTIRSAGHCDSVLTCEEDIHLQSERR